MTGTKLMDEVKYNLGIIYDLPADAITDEMFDFLKIVAIGANKYKMNNWLEPQGVKCSEKQMHKSINNHFKHSKFAGITARDAETGLDPLLNLVTRGLMLYTRRKRNIRHSDDT